MQAAFLVLFFSSTLLYGQSQSGALEQGFKKPPHTAKSITWMHVMSGNMSKEGVTKDLEAQLQAIMDKNGDDFLLGEEYMKAWGYNWDNNDSIKLSN